MVNIDIDEEDEVDTKDVDDDDDLLQVLSPPEGYRDGASSPLLMPEDHHNRRSMTYLQQLPATTTNIACPEDSEEAKESWRSHGKSKFFSNPLCFFVDSELLILS